MTDLVTWVDAWEATYPVAHDDLLDPYQGMTHLDRVGLCQLVKWKFPTDARRRRRTLKLIERAPDEAIVHYSRRAFVCNDDLGALLLAQWTSKGVGPAVGSALLMAAQPTRYSVIDVNAISSLHALGYCPEPRKAKQVVNDDWLPFLAGVRRLAGEVDRPLRHLDRALFKARGNTGLPGSTTPSASPVSPVNPFRYPVVLTGHAGAWDRAVALQAGRVLQPEQSLADRHIEAYLYVLALDQLLRAIEAIANATGDAHLRGHHDQFRAAHPDAGHVRDVITHFEDYEAGEGWFQEGGAMTPLNIFAERGDGTFWLRINHLRLEVGQSARDCQDLAYQALRAEQRYRHRIIDEGPSGSGQPS